MTRQDDPNVMETGADERPAPSDATSGEGDVSPLPGFAALTVVTAVEGDGWTKTFQDEELAGITNRALGAAARHLDLPPTIETEISVTFADDATVAEANGAWRGKDRPTNILSFPMVQLEPGDLPGPLAGDLLLAFETVAREAAAEGKTLSDHLSHLLVHGFLHLMGYDHIDEDEAAAMEATEIAILGELGVSDPYADPAEKPASQATAGHATTSHATD